MKFPLKILLYREIHFHPSPTQTRAQKQKKLENNFNIFFCALIKTFFSSPQRSCECVCESRTQLNREREREQHTPVISN